jgi:hypothetical protein
MVSGQIFGIRPESPVPRGAVETPRTRHRRAVRTKTRLAAHAGTRPPKRISHCEAEAGRFSRQRPRKQLSVW